MAAAKGLRVVKDGEKVPQRRQMTVEEAAEDGDELDLAYATRRRLTKAIGDDKTSPRDLAALTRRLDDVVEKIKTLEAAEVKAKEADGNGDVGDEAFDATAV